MTITMELSYDQVLAVTNLLNTLSESHISSTSNDLPSEVQSLTPAPETPSEASDDQEQLDQPNNIKPRTKMPAFGMKASQVAAHKAKTLETDIKASKKVEAKKEKQEIEAKLQAEVAEITATSIASEPPTTNPVKHWEL